MLELVPDTLTLCPAYRDTAAEGSSPAFCRTVCSLRVPLKRDEAISPFVVCSLRRAHRMSLALFATLSSRPAAAPFP